MCFNYRSLDFYATQADQDNSNQTNKKSSPITPSTSRSSFPFTAPTNMCSFPVTTQSNRSPCMVTAPVTAAISSSIAQQISSPPFGISLSHPTQAAVSVQAPCTKYLTTTNQKQQLYFTATPPAPKNIATNQKIAAFYVQPPGSKNLKNSSKNGHFQYCVSVLRIISSFNYLSKFPLIHTC